MEINGYCESTWEEVAGSLEDCIIFNPDSDHDEEEEEEEEEERKRLVLLRPREGSGPCQITINFMERPCKVHSICLRSTAQLFELYSLSELHSDNEYVCTVHCENATGIYDSNCEGETISEEKGVPRNRISLMNRPSKSSVSSIKEDKSPLFEEVKALMNRPFKCSLSSMEKDKTPPFEEVKQPYIESVHRQNLAILDKPKDGILQNMLQRDMNEFPKHITKGKSHSSDEDSWVDVNLSDSLGLDSSCEAGAAFCLETLNGRRDMKVAADKKPEISVKEDHWKIKDPNDRNGHEHPINNIYFHVQSLEENIRTVSISESSKENKQVEEARQGDISIPSFFMNNLRPEKTFYKAKIEIVNAKPCMSLTIRLPSVQDKHSVEVEEICLHAIPVAAVMEGMEYTGFSSRCIPFGSSFGGSLLEMLAPSILQMSTGGFGQSPEMFFAGPFNGSEESDLSECESYLSESSTTSQSSMTESSVSLDERYLTNLLLYQKNMFHSVQSAAPSPDEGGQSVNECDNNSRHVEGALLHYKHEIDEIRGKLRQGGLGRNYSKSSKMAEVKQQPTQVFVNQEVENHLQQSNSKDVEHRNTNKVCNRCCEEYQERTMGDLFERIDRLEALCERIEGNVLNALDNMERRIQLLESQKMLPKQALTTGMDGVTSKARVYSSHDISSSTSGSIIPNGQMKHEFLKSAPAQSSLEIPVSVSISNISSSSFPYCSPCIDISSSFIPSSLNGLNEKPSSPMESLEPYLPVSSSDAELYASASTHLDQQGLKNKGEHCAHNLSSKVSQDAECAPEVISTATGYAGASICEHTTLNEKALLSIDEALASALAAFSASVAADEEKTSKCTESPCSTLQVENIDEGEICYHDDPNIYLSEEVRYISQESMDWPPYSSSRESQAARYILNRSTLNGPKVEARQAESSIGSDYLTQFNHDEMKKMDFSSSTLLDVSFRTYNAYQATTPLEALLYDHIPQKAGETMGLKECTETKFPVNVRKRRPVLLFIEDEGLGDFIIVSPSNSCCPVSVGHFCQSGRLLPGASPGFESLI